MNRWQKIELGELCEFIKGETGIAKAPAGPYPLVTTGAERKTCDSYQFDAKAVCLPTISSAGHGKKSLNYIHYQEGKFALGTILVALIPKDENQLNAKYLHTYLFHYKDILIVPLQKGAANVSLPIKKVKKIRIPVPPISEQLKLTNLLQNIDSDYCELLKENNYQIDLIKKLRQKILQEAIEGKLTADWRAENPDVEPAGELLARIRAEKAQLIKDKKIKKQKPLPPIREEEKPFELPAGWVWCRLGDLISISSGDALILSDMKEGQIPVFGGNGINGYHDDYNTDEVTITIGRVGAYCGAVHLTPEYAWITDNCFRVYYSKRNIDMNYFVLHLKQMELGKMSFKGAQPVISGKRVYPLITQLPSLLEQKAIVAKVEKLFVICDQLETQITNNKTHAEQLMQAVLKEAFTQTSEQDEKAAAHA